MRVTLLMRSILTITFFFTAALAQYPKSTKRGLVAVHSDNPGDNSLFVQPNNGLTWYYNYGMNVSSDYASISQSDLEFVPMQWGVSNTTGSSFLHNVTSIIKSGRNITHVLSFNEPDVNFNASGSQVSPDLAAASWILNFEPLRKMGIKAGAPVVFASESGFTWLEEFYKACEKRNSTCEADFMNIHVFGNISYVQGYLDEYKKKYPKMPLWITEFALSYSPMEATQQLFNQSLALFDNDTSIERYSYFGAFRASASGVGWNASMLDGVGKLTDIGSWYLGGAEIDTTKTTSEAPATSSSSVKNSGGVILRSREVLGSVLLGVGITFSLMFC